MNDCTSLENIFNYSFKMGNTSLLRAEVHTEWLFRPDGLCCIPIHSVVINAPTAQLMVSIPQPIQELR